VIAYFRGENKVILNCQRPLWEGDQEVVKKSGRDEPMWVAMHICMEATPGISLFSDLYLNLAKMVCLSYYFYVFSSTKSDIKRAQQVLLGSRVGGRTSRGDERWHKQHIHM
jgi:hypothetical protein